MSSSKRGKPSAASGESDQAHDFGSVCKATAKGSSALLVVRAKPGAREARIVGVSEECVEIAIDEEPRDGMANTGLVFFLARQLGVSKSAVVLKRGARGRDKVFEIEGLSVSQIMRGLRAGVDEE